MYLIYIINQIHQLPNNLKNIIFNYNSDGEVYDFPKDKGILEIILSKMVILCNLKRTKSDMY